MKVSFCVVVVTFFVSLRFACADKVHKRFCLRFAFASWEPDLVHPRPFAIVCFVLQIFSRLRLLRSCENCAKVLGCMLAFKWRCPYLFSYMRGEGESGYHDDLKAHVHPRTFARYSHIRFWTYQKASFNKRLFGKQRERSQRLLDPSGPLNEIGVFTNSFSLYFFNLRPEDFDKCSISPFSAIAMVTLVIDITIVTRTNLISKNY